MASAPDGELHKLGLGHLEVIGTRFIDEHHEIHDYPGDKADDHKDHSDSSEDSDYHHAIYDHVDIDKQDYSDFGDGIILVLASASATDPPMEEVQPETYPGFCRWRTT